MRKTKYGKGDTYRRVDTKKFGENYERIFKNWSKKNDNSRKRNK